MDVHLRGMYKPDVEYEGQLLLPHSCHALQFIAPYGSIM